ncbi:MAG: XTP/dITP diphosphatase [candidate division KSB1 bacterium]|nr:XTP/dITP diphosphatase [candidate division KSB1 bacterium]
MAAAKTRIVVATRNRDKLREICELLDADRFEILGLDDVQGVPEVEEDGATLEENALKKARVAAQVTGLPALADDTGLEVEALGGAPGVYSSRYAGEGATYADNVRKLLNELRGVPFEQRRARFRCVVALVHDGVEEVVEGTCPGVITEEPRGEGGFGYDPVFLVPEVGKTFAEMSLEEKNAVSHRGKAFRAAARLLRRILEEREAN